MSGVGFQELLLLFIIGLLILGPERLPRVASQIGRWVGRARRTANQLRYQLEREIALADIEKTGRDSGKKPDAPEKPGPEPEPEPAPEHSGGDSSATAADTTGAETIAKPPAPGTPPAGESSPESGDDVDRA